MASKTIKLRVNSIRLYYLDDQCRIVGTRKEVYGIGINDILEYKWNGDTCRLKKWAVKKLRVDNSRDFKFEVRTTKGRFLYSK